MKTIQTMIDHQIWANKRLLEAMRAGGADNREALKLFRHLAIAEQVWIARLNGESSAHLVLWSDDGSLEEIESLLAGNEERYAAYLAALTEEKLDEILVYANQSGAAFRTPIRDILTHVALHGQYHRGQVNRAIRQASGEPAALDYIVYSRLST